MPKSIKQINKNFKGAAEAFSKVGSIAVRAAHNFNLSIEDFKKIGLSAEEEDLIVNEIISLTTPIKKPILKIKNIEEINPKTFFNKEKRYEKI